MGREKHVPPSAPPLPHRGFVLGVSFSELIAQAASVHPTGLLFGFRKKTENLDTHTHKKKRNPDRSKWGLVLFSRVLLPCPGQLAGDSRQQMSREDKARHTLHQTLIIDGFCRAGLVLGSTPPPQLLLSSTFCASSPSSPPQKQIREQEDFSYLHWVFFFSSVCIFFLVYGIVEGTVASSSETGTAAPSHELAHSSREDAEAEGVF